jgi:hypothetical protein
MTALHALPNLPHTPHSETTLNARLFIAISFILI